MTRAPGRARVRSIKARTFTTAAVLAALLGIFLVPSSTASNHIDVRRAFVIDNRFVPKAVTVARGDAVAWIFPRRNFNPHNVTVGRAPRGAPRRAYVSPRAVRGGSRFARRFVRPGRYAFGCTIHPWMRMRVNVRRR